VELNGNGFIVFFIFTKMYRKVVLSSKQEYVKIILVFGSCKQGNKNQNEWRA
jgi:hypothetical protein